jgi:hypothetical protein
MSETPPDWATSIPSTAKVQLPATGQQITRPSTVWLKDEGAKLIEMLLRRVVLAIVGIFTPNIPAATQLQTWAADVGANISAAGGHISATWNNFWSGVFGTSAGSTGTATDVTTAASYVTATANTADANATLALGNVSDAEKAITGGYYGTAGTASSTDVHTVLAAINARLTALEP